MTLRNAVFALWIAFGAYWLIAALGAKASFPVAYPRYRAHTKMLIPFVL